MSKPPLYLLAAHFALPRAFFIHGARVLSWALPLRGGPNSEGTHTPGCGSGALRARARPAAALPIIRLADRRRPFTSGPASQLQSEIVDYTVHTPALKRFPFSTKIGLAALWNTVQDL